jgi:ATP/maltotriose-dependent transcriptional regulator MalT
MRKAVKRKVSAIVPRKRLFSALDAGLKKGGAWICAQPGAGKTALAASYLQARRSKALWFQVAAADADSSTLFYRLAGAIEHSTRKSRKPMPLFTPEYAADLPGFAGRFFGQAFERLKPPCVIVFDNVHEVPADSAVGPILRALLEIAPPGVGFIGISRDEPPAVLARAVAYGGLSVIDWETLQLQAEETAAIAAAHGVTGASAVAEAHRQCGGWVAGLTLLLQRMRDGATIPEQAPSRAMFGYFAGEVLDRLPAAAGEVLMRTAFFPQFSKEMAIAATANAEAAKVVDGLARSGYFVSRSAGADYRYHDMFREFLLVAARERLGDAGYAGAARKAATLLDANGQIAAAVAVYRDAADWPAVAGIVVRDAHTLIEQGRWQSLMGWITCLPTALLDAEPWLRFWLAICRLTADPPAGRNELEHVYAAFAANGDKAGQALTASALIESYSMLFADVERIDHWIDALNELVRGGVVLPPDLEVRVRVSLLVGLLSRRPGDPHLRQMHIWLDQFLAAQINSSLKLQLFLSVFPYVYWHADAAQAQRLVDMVARLVALPETTPLARLFGAMCLLFNVSTLADFPVAKDLYARAMQVADDFGLGFAAPMLKSFFAYAALISGEIEVARRVIDENSAARFADTSTTMFWQVQILIAWLAAHDGDRAAAVDATRYFRKRMHESGALHGPMQANGCTMLAQAMVLVGDFEEAREMLACARDEMEKFTVKFPLLDAQYHFIAAACAFAEGNKIEALEHLRAGFGISSAHDYSGLIMWSSRLCAQLCFEAQQSGIETDYVRKIIRRHHLAPPTPDTDNWPWPVQVYTLGRFEVLADGNPLAYGRKKPLRPLELLKYLAAHGTRMIAETRVADALWPDLDGDEALNTLAINVHRLRRLLGRADTIVYQGRRIGLNPQRVWCDVAVFEWRLINAASADDDAKRAGLIKSARLLYRGDLLPDDDAAPWVMRLRVRLRAQFSAA